MNIQTLKPSIHHTRHLTIVILLIFLCLCNSPATRAQDLPIALRSNTELSPISPDAFKALAVDYHQAYINRNGSKSNMRAAIQARNRMIFATVDQMDLNFYNYQKKTRHRRAFFDTLLDILEIGASTAISITNGERARSLIAEGLGFGQLSRAAINKNFSLGETQILFNKMVSKRAQILSNVLPKTVQNVNQYPWESALIDLLSYYHAGTIDGALENLNIDTGAEAAQATRHVTQLKIASAEDLGTALTLDDLVANLFTNARNADTAISTPAINKLKSALKSLIDQGINIGVSPTDIDRLTVDELDELYTTVRIQFVTDETQRGNLKKLADALK
ncbi:MAG: hypothetical protein AUG51_15215 [Acidobacteria bacterium 13_1_20CM_3_53_8]|nr:MAG: hypothetical protein AUG51_15215 [Acidobacteria bacterium 13_1_20CM_3_53_8]